MRRLVCLALTLAALLLPSWARPPIPQQQSIFRPVVGQKAMVACAEPLAARAGADVLRQGGNAIDAAVTMAFVMAVTLPEAGNLGGGGFLLVRHQGQVQALDFRETAPSAAHRDMYLRGGQVDRDLATRGYLAVAVPGTVAGLAAALERYGTLSLAQAVEPARRLAAEGFEVSPYLAEQLAEEAPELAAFPASAEIFLPGGSPPRPGQLLVQKDLAWSLEQIARQGPDAFYRGEIARRLIACMERHGGILSAADLAGYRARWREPVHGTYRGYEIWSMPPPSSGGVHLIQMLNILEGYDLRSLGQNSAAELHLLVEAMRSAYADRSRWLGDPDFVKVPLGWLTSKAYADRLRADIPRGRARRSSQVAPGQPPDDESPDTTHLSVVDAQGNAVALTYTLNFSYGSHAVAEGTGILLNNEMDDFSAAPGQPNAFGLVGGEYNAIAPGKRPLSSMTPTLVTRQGRLAMVLGSPGGSRIITTVLQVFLNVAEFGRNAQSAVSAPRVHHQWLPDEVFYEEGISPDTLALLQGWGHPLTPSRSFGHAILIVAGPDGTLEGGVDPRRPGTALGL